MGEAALDTYAERLRPAQQSTFPTAVKSHERLLKCTVRLVPDEDLVAEQQLRSRVSGQFLGSGYVRKSAKLLKEMVDATGIEPVTPSMSTRCSPAELRIRRRAPKKRFGAGRAVV